MQYVVSFSGGVTSWAAAKRIVERHGAKNTTLIFADTKMEDEDLYRFLDEAALNIGAPLVKLSDGRTPWDVFFDVRYLGNSRVDPCSRVLKREPLNECATYGWDPQTTTHCIGYDCFESHRAERFRAAMARRGWPHVCAPLADYDPPMSKAGCFEWLAREGIELPRLYKMGFSHNNCGGFCVKAGQGHFATLLRQLPERYAFHEQKEQELRAYLGKDVSILRDRTGGESKPLTLRDFRLRLEAGGQCDMFDIGGCGCFAQPEEDAS